MTTAENVVRIEAEALRRLADVFILERREEPGGLERGFRSRVLYRLMPKEVRS